MDDLPRMTRETSEEGHFRLQLNSQLFVGRGHLKVPFVLKTLHDHSGIGPKEYYYFILVLEMITVFHKVFIITDVILQILPF